MLEIETKNTPPDPSRVEQRMSWKSMIRCVYIMCFKKITMVLVCGANNVRFLRNRLVVGEYAVLPMFDYLHNCIVG